MPYEPQYQRNVAPPLPLERPPTGYNPQFGKPALSLPHPLFRKARILGCIIAALVIAGAIAINPHARPEFRMAASTLLVLSIIGAIGWTIKTYSFERIALCLFIVGITALCVGGFGAWFGLSPTRVYVLISFFGGIIGFTGFGMVEGSFFPTPEPPPPPAQTPLRQTVYGEARTATDWEIHEALRDKNRHPDNSGYRYED